MTLEVQGLAGGWKLLGRSRTDSDGRSADVMPSHQRLQPGTYRLTFDNGRRSFAVVERSMSDRPLEYLSRELNRRAGRFRPAYFGAGSL